MTSLAPISATGILMASSVNPTEAHSTALTTFEAGNLESYDFGHQVTVLDAAAGVRPRHLVAKAEEEGLEPGIAPDAPGVELIFSIKIGQEWRQLGGAITDRNAFARLPFPRDLELSPGLYDISVAGRDSSVRAGSGRLLITGDRPTLLIDVDGPALDDSRHNWGRFFRRNILHLHNEPTRGAYEALQELSQHYQIIYLAPLRDESALEQMREDLFRSGKLPAGPIVTNDFGLRLKENSRTASLQRLEEFVDNAIAELRGFNGVPVVAGIALDDRYRRHFSAMKRHGLETIAFPDSNIRFWQVWRWINFRKKERSQKTTKAWDIIRNFFSSKREFLTQQARTLFGQRHHPNPHVSFQAELDLVTGAQLYFGNGATLYTDGEEAFEAVKALFRGAETVFAEIFEFAPDRVGNEFAQIFSENASQGKPVRLTVDFFGSRGWMPRAIGFFRRMARQGVQISRFTFSLAEFPDFLNALFFRTHRKVAALKIRGEDGHIRDVAVLGGRNWKQEYWKERYDNTIVVEGPVVQPIVHHLARVAEMARSPLRPKENALFAVKTQSHPDGLPARYIVHYPKEDLNIQRAFVSMLNNPSSNVFMMESPFPLMSELMRELIATKRAHPEKDIVWITGTFKMGQYGPGDALRDAQALILKKHGIRVVVRTPLNGHSLSPMHVKRFTDGQSFYVGSWNPDEQSNKDLEAGVILSPNPDDPAANAKLQTMTDDVRHDAELGIDIETWLQKILPESTGDVGDLYRRLLLKIAPKLQQSLNYFL